MQGRNLCLGVVLFIITINYLGKDVNSTFIKLIEEAREVFLNPGWGRGNTKGTYMLTNRMMLLI